MPPPAPARRREPKIKLGPPLNGIDGRKSGSFEGFNYSPANKASGITWSEAEFHARLLGSAIHRIGYERWLRNLAVGLGNAISALSSAPDSAPAVARIIVSLQSRSDHPSALVRKHVAWALSQYGMQKADAVPPESEKGK